MKSLILDTSSEYALLAVAENTQVLQTIQLAGGPALSKCLASDLKKIIDIHPPPYNRMILGIGPGSFTGIRVGASIAQALCFGWQIPLYTASSLSSFAPFFEKPFAIAMDARSGGIYVQINFNEPTLLSPSDALKELSAYSCIASPHPSRILDRLPEIKEKAQWVETRPNPIYLMKTALQASTPLVLKYLSTP